MKITKITPLICDAYRTNWVFVRVDTDAGVHGVGEATLEYREKTVAEAIAELSRSFVGKDPSRIQELWHTAYRDVYFRGGPVYQSALSAVEIALWDIKGKTLGVPVYELLGGKVRDAIELEPQNVRVNMVVAGYIRTTRWDALDPAHVTRRRANIPLGKEASAGDIAKAVMFLSESDRITGARLVVDGGVTTQMVPPDCEV
jgi:hypothetical protein